MSAEKATVDVDLGVDLGEYVHMEDYGNFSGKGSDQNGAIRQKDMKFMQYNGLNEKMLRIWVDLSNDFTYFTSSGNKTSDHTRIAYASINNTIKTHLTEMSPYADELVVVIQHPNTVTGAWSVDAMRTRYRYAVKALVSAFPKCTYFEAGNEPDLSTGSCYSTVQQYYDCYYKPHYTALKQVNTELNLTGTDKELKLGGPVSCMFMPTNRDPDGNRNDYYIRDFIRAYKSDTSADKRLDFISYHQYGGSYKGDVAFMGTEQNLVRSWLTESYNGETLSADLPVFISETGIFAGSQSSSAGLYADLFVEAAGIASMNYQYIQNGGNGQMYPFSWVPRHTQNNGWRKNILLNDRLNNSSGAVVYKFTPFGNMFKMLAMQRDMRVKAEVTPKRSGRAGKGDSLGMYAFATKDENGAGVMMWNYQYDNNSSLASPFNSSVISYDVDVTINNISSIPSLRGKDVLVKLYMIDNANGSFAHNENGVIQGVLSENESGEITVDKTLANMDNANIVPYEEYVVTPENDSITLSYSFGRNRFRYVELLPAASYNLAGNRRVFSDAPLGLASKNAVDGDPSTRWGARDANYPYYITSDLGEVCYISSVETEWYKYDQRAYKYTVSVSSDNESYTVVSSKEDNARRGITSDAVGMEARYVRIDVLGCEPAGGYASISELRIFGRGGQIDMSTQAVPVVQRISDGKTYFASGTADQSNMAWNAFDGDPLTEWQSSGMGDDQYIGVDMGRSLRITAAQIDWYSNAGRYYKYVIEASNDGEVYTTIVDKSNNTVRGTTSDEFDVYARYIRIRPVGSNAGSLVNARIKDIRIMGEEIKAWLKSAKAEKQIDGVWQSSEKANASSINRMFDGKSTTRWGVSDGDYPYRLTFDLGTDHDISDIETEWFEGDGNKNQRIYRYIIETRAESGDEFIVAADRSDNHDFRSTIDAVGKRARFVRLTILGVSDGGYASICELRIYSAVSGTRIFDPEFTDGTNVVNSASDTMRLSAEVDNRFGQSSAKGELICAVYDSNGRLLRHVSSPFSVQTGNRQEVSAVMDDISAGQCVRGYIWEMDKLTPLGNSTEGKYYVVSD